jgi:heme-degrading monooxygenase HmoA
MAIGVLINVPNPSQEQMSGMAEELIPKIKDQPGFVLHLSGPQDDNTFRVIEVWESREHHGNWVQNHVIPSAERAGGVQGIEPTYFNVENVVRKP